VESLNLIELVDTLASLVLPNAKKRGIELKFSKPDQAILVSANRAEMNQVVLNLMKNAVDAMPDGGSLKIELAAENSGGIDWAVLRVEDSGCGIPEESRDNIFIPLYTTKSQSEGHLGLGLSIIYGIIMRLRGSIDAENLLPRGCRFTVRIPRYRTE
jgi:two-component system, NtrC family, sensor kinase